jgi:hypothetical protein
MKQKQIFNQMFFGFLSIYLLYQLSELTDATKQTNMKATVLQETAAAWEKQYKKEPCTQTHT